MQGRFITSGLFRYARYPSYCGEIALWTGLALFAAAHLRSPAAVAAVACSPVFTYLLLIYVSGVSLQVLPSPPHFRPRTRCCHVQVGNVKYPLFCVPGAGVLADAWDMPGPRAPGRVRLPPPAMHAGCNSWSCATACAANFS